MLTITMTMLAQLTTYSELRVIEGEVDNLTPLAANNEWSFSTQIRLRATNFRFIWLIYTFVLTEVDT
jgi:hypothetical protein